MTQDTPTTVIDVYRLMERLSEEHDADAALIEERDSGRCGVVLEFELEDDR